MSEYTGKFIGAKYESKVYLADGTSQMVYTDYKLITASEASAFLGEPVIDVKASDKVVNRYDTEDGTAPSTSKVINGKRRFSRN